MQDLIISRPRNEDIDLINGFFATVLNDTFEKNEIIHLVELLEEEIEVKKDCLKQDIESNGEKRFFLIGKFNNKIVGTIEYGPSSSLINTCTDGVLKEVKEIGTIFVDPEYQQKGIGNRLLTHLLKEMKNKGIDEICLDSGYKSAQRIWFKKFGHPQYQIKNYWGEGNDHMIWRLKIDELL